MFPGEVPGKFRESSGKVPGKFRESSGENSGKVPEIPGKFRKLRASSERRFGNWFGLEIQAEPRVPEIPGEFRKFRGSSGNSGEVPESSGASSRKIPETFRNIWSQSRCACSGDTVFLKSWLLLFDCNSILQAVPEVRAAGFDSQLKNMRIWPTQLVATHGPSECGRNHCKDRWGI